MTAFWAGPAATHLLAAFGADVVKVESIQRPDGIRYSGGMRKDVDDWWEYGWVFHAMNTNKRSVTLDLGSDDGRRLFNKLVADADVVIENFSPRVMDHFGLTADALLAVNPRLVIARMPAFGLDGPWRDRVGFAPTMEQIAGLAWVTGLPDGPPVPPRGACDPLAGVHAAFAVMAALSVRRAHRRRPTRRAADDRNGVERHRDSADGSRGIRRDAEPPGQSWSWLGRPEPLPLRGRRRLDRRHRRHRRAVAVRWLNVMGRPSWTDDDRFGSRRRAAERADDIDQRLQDWFGGQELRCAVDDLAGVGIPAAPVVSPSLVTENPQLNDRGFFETLDHPRTGPGRYPRPPFAPLGGQRRWLMRPPPTLGEHNGEVLRDLCGLTRSRPRASGVCRGDRDPAQGSVTAGRVL